MHVLAFVLLFQAAPPADLPVEQTKKNIKVLKGLPTSQLIPVMAFMSNSLGVTCAHCHTGQFDSDEKPAKNVARNMIAMQRAINHEQFGGKLMVTCNTCHRGTTVPDPTPNVAAAGWATRPASTTPQYVDPEDALAKFPKTPENVKRRVITGTVERFNGRDEPKSAPFTLTLEGDKVTYASELPHPPEGRRALMIYQLIAPKADTLRADQFLIDDVIRHRYRETETALGPLPEQVDWEDFRESGGVKLPYRARWSRADYRITYTITEIVSE